MGRFEGTYLKLASYRDAYIAATQAVERAGSRVEAVKTRMMLGDKAAEGGAGRGTGRACSGAERSCPSALPLDNWPGVGNRQSGYRLERQPGKGEAGKRPPCVARYFGEQEDSQA